MERFNVISNKKEKKKRKTITFNHFLGIPYYVFLIFLILLPVLLLFLYSFQDGNSGFELTFSLMHYVNFFKESVFLTSMVRSLSIAGIATVFTLAIGYPLAYLISRSKASVAKLLIVLVTSPMWINMILRVQAIKQVLEMIHPSLPTNDVSLILGMVYIYLPFMVLPIYTVLSKMDKSLFESAADLGATKLKTITRVIIPMSLSGVLSGIIMVFLPIATTMIIPKYLGSGRSLIGNIIEESMTNRLYGGYGYGAAIAVVLAIIIFGLVQLMKRVNKYQGGDQHESE